VEKLDLADKMTKGIIYYCDFNCDPAIQYICLQQLKKAWQGDVVSVSLNQPLDFGKNFIAEGKRSYQMMINQIVKALEMSTVDYVFFAESDILYHESHFNFIPTEDDVFYYNLNNVRWEYPNDRVIEYDGLTSLSQLCVNRKYALNHFRLRLGSMGEDIKGEPKFARVWGYEPGLKKKRNGALTQEKSGYWTSEFPNVDIRHGRTFSKTKTRLEDFKHKPTGFQEMKLDDVRGWKLKLLFAGLLPSIS
jgi:hypothetical protein